MIRHNKTLIEIRKQKGYSAKQMADRLNMSRGYYSHLENGTRNFPEELIQQVAGIFGVDVKVIRDSIGENERWKSIAGNWISKIKINEKSAIKAFKEDAFLQRSSDDEILLKNFIKFIEFNIGSSIREELISDPMKKEHLLSKLK